MSLSEKLEELKSGRNINMEKSEQLKSIDEIERILGDIGVSLESKFEIPLSTRIGATAKSN